MSTQSCPWCSSWRAQILGMDMHWMERFQWAYESSTLMGIKSFTPKNPASKIVVIPLERSLAGRHANCGLVLSLRQKWRIFWGLWSTVLQILMNWINIIVKIIITSLAEVLCWWGASRDGLTCISVAYLHTCVHACLPYLTMTPLINSYIIFILCVEWMIPLPHLLRFPGERSIFQVLLYSELTGHPSGTAGN